MDDPRNDLGLERPVRDALLPPRAARAHGGQRLSLQKFNLGDVPAAFQLRHALGLGHVRVVVEG